MSIHPAKFRFSFIRTRKVNGSAISKITPCIYGPEEWNDNSIKWSRDKRTHAILTKFVDTFSFVMEDADYLRACFSEETVFAKVCFSVEEYDLESFTYKPYYSGDIDFYSIEDDPYTVKVSLFEVGFKVAFDANYDTVYEIADTTDAVRYTGLTLLNKAFYNCSYARSVYDDSIEDHFGCYITESENVNITSPFQTIGQSEWDPGNFLFEAKQNIERMKVTFTIKLNTLGAPRNMRNIPLSSDSTGGIIVFLKRNNDMEGKFWSKSDHNIDNYPIFRGQYEGASNTEGQENIIWIGDIKSGDRFYLIVAYNSRYYTGNGHNPLMLDVNINGTATFDIFHRVKRNHDIKGLRPHELLVHLVKKATDGRYDRIIPGPLKEGEAANLLISSGDWIRKVKNAKIKTSLKDFFEAMQAMFGLTFSFETDQEGRDTLRIISVNDVFDRERCLLTLDDIRDLRVSVANDYIYNRLKIGYKDRSYDKLNGRYEFNTEFQFAVNTDGQSRELKLVSPYRADMYGTEFLLLDYDNKESTDSVNDNDVFVYYTTTTTNGLYDLDHSLTEWNWPSRDTAFNVRLSPKSCLLRQEEYIRSLFRFSGDVLKFASSPKGFEADTGNMRERADVALSGQSLFRPVVYEFETMVPGNISDLVASGCYGYVEVRNGNQILRGFILSLSENPGRNKSQTWKLLAMDN